MKKLSIIIVNWNTADLLKKCLDSVFAHQPPFDFEVIVFDNASADNTRQILSDFPKIQSIYHDKNIGFAAANNMAVQYCSGEFLLLLNPDTEIKSDILTRSVEYMEHSNFAILGVRLRLPDGKIQVSSGNFPSLRTMISQNIYSAMLRLHMKAPVRILSRLLGTEISQLFHRYGLWDPFTIQRTDWVSGAYFLLRREDFLETGKFDEQFFLFSEEIDFCFRAAKRGKQAVFWGKDEILHYSGGSLTQFPEQSFLRHLNSTLYFYRKHYSPATAATYKIFVISGYFAAAVLLTLQLMAKRGNEKLPISQKRSAYLKLIRQYLSSGAQNDNMEI